MFNLQNSLDAYKKALQEIGSKGEVSLKQNRNPVIKNTTMTVTKDSIKKSLVDANIITTKGELTHLNIS
jgi:hypothetical protein